MNDMQIGADQDRAQKESTLIRHMIVLAKHKRLIIGAPLLAGIAAAAISMALPNVYRANTKLLPPQQAQSGAAALLSQLGGVAGAAASAAGLKNPNDLYIGMLKSRAISDKLIAKYDLKRAYDTESLETARRTLDGNTFIMSGKDGLITIDVEDGDKKRVVLLANSYVEELLKLTKVVALTEAAQRRVFFERQLEASKNNLATAEMALKRAIDTGGVISVDGDSRVIVETAGRLRAQISANEIKLSSMKAFVTSDNPDYQRTEQELSSLRGELSRLENGRPAGDASPAKQGGLESIKILRDVKYHQMLYELLAKQYEVARLDEAKDTSVIQVLDAAIEPERKVKPKRAIIVLMTAIFAFFAAVAWAFSAEAKARALEVAETAAQWNTLRGYLGLRAKRGPAL
jgi:tyrosine-protein kinase Etk/Wzc